MSDKSEGPGWWIASDGKWYPPELHPASPKAEVAGVQTPVDQASTPAAEVPAGQVSVQPTDETALRRRQADKEVAPGRQFPDLFQKALQGSHLADNITVKYDGEDRRNSVTTSNPGPARMTTRTTGGGVPVTAGTAGVTFAAAPAKRKWRKGR